MEENTTEEKKKLFLLDGFALIFRAYYAYIKNPLTNAEGKNVSAMYGYVSTLWELISKEKPTHLALAMDAPGPTNRAKEHTFYKANRDETPEDIKDSIPYIIKLTEAFNIPILLKEGYEADDVIGTLAKAAEKEGFEVYMVTPDKDFGQLVSENIFMYKPGRGGKPREILGVPQILAKWDIKDPLQVIDILGLMGDASDNIPGIRGVGEKTAIKLLKEYGSIENLLQNTVHLKGKLKEKVETDSQAALISKSLATIILDVPLEYNFDDFVLGDFNEAALNELFVELGFKHLGKRIFGAEYTPNQEAKKEPTGKPNLVAAAGGVQGDLFATASETQQAIANQMKAEEKGKTIENTPHEYHLIDTPEKRKKLIADLVKQSAVAFDTETTSVDANNAELVGMSFSWKEAEAYYVPIPEDQAEAKAIVKEFEGFFGNEKIDKIGQNLKYDMIVLKWYDMEVAGKIIDTMIQHYLIEPDLRHNLDYLSENYLGYSPVSITTLIGKKGKKQGSMRDVPVAKVAEYAGEDADLALQLSKKFQPILEEQSFGDLYKNVEAPLVYVLTEMEYNGIRIDAEFLDKYSDELKYELRILEERIYETAGVEFNLDSPKQLGEVLFDKMKIPYKGAKTKTGQYSTGEEKLKRLAKKHDIAKSILEFRGLNKLKNTYVGALPRLINPKTGLIHSSFNQAVASTGRLSSTNPNLQNIPIRTEKGRKVRQAFIPRSEDYTMLAADYSQIELRIIAAMSKDEGMMNAFKNGLDIHTATAAKVYDIPLEEVTKDQRRNAKAVNFGLIYGQGAFALSKDLGIKSSEAKELIESYFEEYSRIKEFMTESVDKVRAEGYVETILGRRRYLPNINSRNQVVRGHAERNATNAPIQGSAADMIKVAMVNIHREMKKREMKSKMMLQVHDELVFDAHLSEVEELQALLQDKMVNAVKIAVPIEIGMGLGANWLEAH